MTEKEFKLVEEVMVTQRGKFMVNTYLETDVKEFIHQGDKIFTEDYGKDNVSNEEYDYAQKKWEKFKKKAGEELVR